jgi:hypothetical protein
MSSQPSGQTDEVAVRRRSESEPGTGSEAILVVDDNARLCDLAKRALSSGGWIMHIESSRSTALAAAASELCARLERLCDAGRRRTAASFGAGLPAA